MAWRDIGDGGLMGAIVHVRVLKRGVTHVTLRFSQEDTERVLRLRPGDLKEIV